MVLCRGLTLKFVRDFGVVDTNGHPRLGKSPSIVYHIPSGLWDGFTLTFDQAVQFLEARPDQDEDLVLYLHEI